MNPWPRQVGLGAFCKNSGASSTCVIFPCKTCSREFATEYGLSQHVLQSRDLAHGNSVQAVINAADRAAEEASWAAPFASRLCVLQQLVQRGPAPSGLPGNDVAVDLHAGLRASLAAVEPDAKKKRSLGRHTLWSARCQRLRCARRCLPLLQRSGIAREGRRQLGRTYLI
jgi:hypothetical protein